MKATLLILAKNVSLNSVINFELLQAPFWCRYPTTVIGNNMFLTDFNCTYQPPTKSRKKNPQKLTQLS